MDLYVQIGVLLAMSAMFSLLAYFYAVNYDTGIRVQKSLDKESVNYSLDSSVTSPTFFVDSRVFTQWAINAKSQRQVYLIYPQSIAPDEALYGAYLHQLDVKLNTKDPADRSLKIRPQSAGNVNNAYYVNDQAPKTVDYLTTFSEEAKVRGRKKMVTVYTFTDSLSSEVIFLCYIK